MTCGAGQRAILATLAVCTLLLLVPSNVAAQKYDYVTVEEEDLIRDAQELPKRVDLFLRLLDNRIVALNLRERSAKEREEARKDLQKWEREEQEVRKIEGAELGAQPLKPDVYLRNETRADLIRGFTQIVGEIMDNIDDAHERNLEVRGPVESLEDALSEQLPRLRKFEAKNSTETKAVSDAIALSERTIEDCRNALKTLPKTEKKNR